MKTGEEISGKTKGGVRNLSWNVFAARCRPFVVFAPPFHAETRSWCAYEFLNRNIFLFSVFFRVIMHSIKIKAFSTRFLFAARCLQHFLRVWYIFLKSSIYDFLQKSNLWLIIFGKIMFLRRHWIVGYMLENWFRVISAKHRTVSCPKILVDNTFLNIFSVWYLFLEPLIANFFLIGLWYIAKKMVSRWIHFGELIKSYLSERLYHVEYSRANSEGKIK